MTQIVNLDIIEALSSALHQISPAPKLVPKPTPISYENIPEQDQEIVRLLRLEKIGGIIAGGAALLWWSGLPVGTHDIDIWFTSEADIRAAMTHLGKIGTSTINTKNAITYSVVVGGKEYTVQLIHRIFPSVEELMKEFDITVCKIATNGTKWWVGPQFAQDYKTKTLRMTHYRKNSLRRFVKYVNYGYQPLPHVWNELLNHPDVNWDYSTMESYEEYADAF